MGGHFTCCVGGGSDPVVNRERTELVTIAAQLYIRDGIITLCYRHGLLPRLLHN
jgi:hypothetical protein